MAKIIKIYRESMPQLKFTGIKYSDDERDDNGSYADKWNEWICRDLFAPLLPISSEIPAGSPEIGIVKFDGMYEYWIGMFTSGLKTPEGYETLRFPAGTIAVCWVKGNPNSGELFGIKIHNDCIAAVKQQGWPLNEELPCFELYDQGRFYNPDKDGNVIMDYCIYLK